MVGLAGCRADEPMASHGTGHGPRILRNPLTLVEQMRTDEASLRPSGP